MRNHAKNLPWLQVRGPLFGKPCTVLRHPFDFGIRRVTHLYWKSSNQCYLNDAGARKKRDNERKREREYEEMEKERK